MKIEKIVDGRDVIFEYEKIKDYGEYTLYNVYKNLFNRKIYLYKTCLSELQKEELARYII